MLMKGLDVQSLLLMIGDVNMVLKLMNRDNKSKWIFEKAYATDTRLMGVVGLRIHWTYGDKKVVDFFHLDYEEFGLDGFDRLVDKEDIEIENKTLSVMGGLGGDMIKLDLESCEKLVSEALLLNDKYLQDLPVDMDELAYYNLDHDISKNDYYKVMKKVTLDISTEIELINYYFMRLVGIDRKGNDLVSDCDFIELENHFMPSTLLRNEVVKKDGYYYVKSLIDDGNKYRLFTSNIWIVDMMVNKVEILDDIPVSTFEAGLMLKKPEYIGVFDVTQGIFSEEIIDKEKVSAMKNFHMNGVLYTEFNKDNSHVRNDIYYLNDDIFCIYFLTDMGQLLLVSFSEKNYDLGKKWMLEESFLEIEIESEFKLDSSLFYDFVNSEYDNFYDFVSCDEDDGR
jgi:hypothetical protein